MKVENSSKCDEGIATAVTNSTFDWGTEDDGGSCPFKIRILF